MSFTCKLRLQIQTIGMFDFLLQLPLDAPRDMNIEDHNVDMANKQSRVKKHVLGTVHSA